MKKIIPIIFLLALSIVTRAQSVKPSLNIVFDGDSQTQWGIWPTKILELLGNAGYTNIRSVNYAISGQNTNQMVNDVSSQIAPRYNSGYNENIVIYYIGYNDTYNGSSTDTKTLHNRLVTYYTTLRNKGFKVLMINLPDGFNRAGIAKINSMYALEKSTISNAFVNCRETGGVFENYANTTYYRDKVHLSVVGCNYLAENYIYSKLVSLINPQTPPVSDLSTGLVSYFKFDETSGSTLDAKGSNHGTASTGVTRGLPGKINGAYIFDSNSDFVSLASPITQKTGTYSFWIKITSISNDLIIMGNNAYYSRVFIGAGNNLKIETNKNGEEFVFFTSFSVATWYHVVLTRDVNTVKFYRNGTSIGSSTIAGSDNLTLSQIGFNGRSFNGTLDELGIWSRPLTAGEVSALYNSGAGKSYPFQGIVAVTGISISPTSSAVGVGLNTTLTSTVLPANASNKAVNWSSGNSAIAIVSSSGMVTGIAPGSTTITAKTQDGNKLATCSVTVSSSTNSLLTGLKFYYKFDETSGTANDEAGSNDGTVSAGVSRGASGILNGAYSFDSNSDFVALSSAITQKTGSYSFWIKLTSISDDLLIMGNNTNNSRILIGKNNNIKLETNTNNEEFAFYNSFTTATWYYIVLTRNENTVKFYRNGNYMGSSTIAGSNNLTLSQIGFNGRSFRGTIDELGIWSKSLTANEVTELYNSGLGNSYPFTSTKSAESNIISQNSIDPYALKTKDDTDFIYPNPATNQLYFKNVDLIPSELFIYDMNGKLILHSQIVKNSMDISAIPKAMYIVKIVNNKGSMFKKLLVK